MLGGLVTLILEAVASFLTLLLLTRGLMRWLRISFINPLGQFVLATTDWIVRPAQKILPASVGLDLSCWISAWLIQAIVVVIGAFFGSGFQNPAALLIVAAVIGIFEVMRNLLHLIMIVVIVAAVLSWVNPRAPIAPMVNALARPFLAPLSRRIPPIGGIDLSPLVLLLILQALLFVLAGTRNHLLALLLT
ncbi:MAG: YggT family protein [Betaproteobacteria bacterium]|nr:YggT family protein [Betaproteobacteria bacterium]